MCALGALSVPEQIFLPSCSLSLQEISKPHSICNLSPPWGTSSRPSRAAETLWHFDVARTDKNMQKLGSVDEILWRLCFTPSSPRAAACHAPGVCVLHPLYCSFGVNSEGSGRREWGRHLSENSHKKTFCSRGHFFASQGKTRRFFVEKVSVPRPES